MNKRAEMDRATLIEELKELIIAECDKDMTPEEIDSEARLIGGEMDLDSLDALQVSLAVKGKYGVRIEEGPAVRKAFASVSALADFILEAQSASAAT